MDSLWLIGSIDDVMKVITWLFLEVLSGVQCHPQQTMQMKFECNKFCKMTVWSMLNWVSKALKTWPPRNVSTCLVCLRAHVLMYLACLRVHVPMCLACLRVYMSMCLPCSHANVLYVPTCSRANMSLVLQIHKREISSVTWIIYNARLVIICRLKKRKHQSGVVFRGVKNIWRNKTVENVHSISISKLYPDFFSLLFHFHETPLTLSVKIRICQSVKDDQFLCVGGQALILRSKKKFVLQVIYWAIIYFPKVNDGTPDECVKSVKSQP